MYVLLFSENYTGFYGDGLLFLEREMIFEKLCFCTLTFSCFAPLQVLIAKGSYRRGFLVNLSIGGCLRGYDSYPYYYTLLML